MSPVAQKSRRLFALFALLAVAALLVGCAAMSGIKEKPQITVADIELKNAGLLENAFTVMLRVMNPNDVGIDVKAVTCNLSLNGREFARGAAESGARLAPYSSVLVPVDVYSSTVDMAGALARALRLGVRGDEASRYALEGTALVGVRGFEVKVPFKSEGDFLRRR